jgi:hypothetical protein
MPFSVFRSQATVRKRSCAVAVVRSRQRREFELLLRLAARPSLTGVIGALGAFERVEAVPVLTDALEDDAGRRTAETALTRLGRSAVPALLRAADLHVPSGKREPLGLCSRSICPGRPNGWYRPRAVEHKCPKLLAASPLLPSSIAQTGIPCGSGVRKEGRNSCP